MSKIIIMSEEQIMELNQKMDAIIEALNFKTKENDLNGEWLNQLEVQKLLQVSSRSLQNYRNQGILSFSKTGGKIRYKRTDVESLLQTNYVKGFMQ